MGKAGSALYARGLRDLRALLSPVRELVSFGTGCLQEGKGATSPGNPPEASPTSEDCSDFSPGFYYILVSSASDTILNALRRQCWVCVNP